MADSPGFKGVLWASGSSLLSTRTLNVTYPLLAVALTDSPAWIGWVMFASTVPGLLCYIPAGALVDRLGARRVLAWSETARAILIGCLCVAMASGVLGLWHLVVVALVEGVLCVISNVAETTLVPTTVSLDRVDTALSTHEAMTHATVLLGRPLGGLLHGIGVLVPFLANAAMFAVAAIMLHRLPDRHHERTRKSPAQLGAGLAELWRNRFLRSATLVTACTNLMVQCLIVVLLITASRERLPPLYVGAVLACPGLGGIVGAFMAPRRHAISQCIGAWTGEGRMSRLFARAGLLGDGRSTMLLLVWACAAGVLLTLVFRQSFLSFAGALVVVGLAGGLSNVTVRTALSREPARVTAASRLGSYGAVVLGPVLGSLLLMHVEPAVVLAILAGGMLTLAGLFTVVPTFRRSLSPREAGR
ncbi:MFS transporter [Nonomuraea sp. ATR24]|uniref:MFS transporter n=1 Tax=Nonomuraea TaxID=83681 RepID=UPI001C5EAA1B|nr:MFS transporter [Nonomuraea ceibae]